MKKLILFLCGIFSIAGGVHAQQINNGNFDAPWVDDALQVGMQPAGWSAVVANASAWGSTMKASLVSQETRTESPVNYNAKLINKFAGGSQWGVSYGFVLPGYITLGNSWLYINSSYFTVSTSDAGVQGGIEFSFRPDSLIGYFKYTPAQTNEIADAAHIRIYSWSGTHTSTSEKGDIALTDNMKDIWSGNSNAMLISKGEYFISEKIGEWTRIAIPIEYINDDIPEKMNIYISASSFLTKDEPFTVGENDILRVDDLQFIYNHKLTEITLDGTPIEGFDKETLEYNGLSMKGNAFPEISWKTDGKDAKVSKETEGNTVKLTVTAADGAQTVYILNFTKTDAVENIDNASLKIYANNGILYIKGNTENLPVEIYNMQGQLVSVHSATENFRPDVLTNSLYIIKIGEKVSRILF
ncbi:PCMD domain-containing protein [Barnesiella propionica]|uniref:PCMD domain-containing protein n=1 Tax=Barnesiella propionica TaxID=2981781 RepID=UPI0011CBD150|nr:PCMD domain-containing protein [Barnesiella propionica]MCU6768607.1 PCMD domain-containing protein [Barnesiella propionica]